MEVQSHTVRFGTDFKHSAATRELKVVINHIKYSWKVELDFGDPIIRQCLP